MNFVCAINLKLTQNKSLKDCCFMCINLYSMSLTLKLFPKSSCSFREVCSRFVMYIEAECGFSMFGSGVYDPGYKRLK